MPRGMIAAPPFMPPMGMRFPGGMPGSMPVMPPLPGGMPQMPNAPQAQAAPQQQPQQQHAPQPQAYAQPYQPYATHPFAQPQVPAQPGYPAPYPDAYALQQAAAMQQIQAAQAALMPYINQSAPEQPQAAETVAEQPQGGIAAQESAAPVRTVPRGRTYSTKGKGIHYSTRV